MQRTARIAMLMTCLGWVALRAGTAAACEPLPCQRGWVLPEAGTIPENAPGILVFVDSASPRVNALANLSLRRDGKPEPATARLRAGVDPRWSAYDITPDAGLVAGSKLELDIASPCAMLPPPRLTASVRVGPRAETPVRLGKLRAWPARRSTLEVSTSGGSCSQRTEAVWVDVEAELDASAEPWSGLLEWQTFVDGARWLPEGTLGVSPPAGGSWAGRGRDRIYALCEDAGADPGLGEGKHSVVLRATLNGSVPLSTPALEIALDCAMARSAPAEGSESLDEPRPEPPPAAPASVKPARQRCGCEVPGADSRSKSSEALALALAALGIFGLRRVRARRRSTPGALR